MKAVGANVFTNFFDGLVGCDQFVALCCVDPIVARIQDRWAGDKHVHFGSAAFAQKRHKAAAGGAADDGVIDNGDFLAADFFADWAEFEVDHALPELAG